MKRLAVLVVLVGCGHFGGNGSARAAYVRDASHHCRVTNHYDKSQCYGWDYAKEEPICESQAVTWYMCENGVESALCPSPVPGLSGSAVSASAQADAT